MVDFIKRASKTGDLDPDEQVLAAVNVTPSPFVVANAGMTGGLIGGGVIGMAAGAAWDGRQRKKDQQEAEGKSLPEVAGRKLVEPKIPTNGALLGVTTKRIVAWRISGLGKPRDVLHSIPLADVDMVRWEQADARWLGGRPASVLIWIGVGESVLACAGISMGAAGKHVEGVVDALEQRLPGKVSVWEG